MQHPIRMSLALAILFSACGPEFSTLHISAPSSSVSIRCDGDSQSVNATDRASLSCLGYMCSSTLAPGSSECMSTATNPFLGTCVEAFFDCFKPVGSCSDGVWEDGHRIESAETETSRRAFFAPGAEEPCILEDHYNNFGAESRLVRRH